MERLHLTVPGALLLTVCCAAAGRAQTAPVLTLQDAVREALAKNDRMLDQRDTVEQADLGVRLARNAFQPKVVPNILGSFGRTDLNSQTYRVDVSQRFSTGTELRLGVGTATAQIPGEPGSSTGDIRFYNADTTLTLSQPLLRGFGRTIARRGVTSAEARRVEAGRLESMAEQQLAIDVASSYYRVVAEQAFVEVARQSLGRARKLRDASEAKLEVGLVSQLDVLRAQQLVAQAETQFFDAQGGVEDARDHLAFLLGRESSAGFNVDGAIPQPDYTPVDAAGVTRAALANRLDLKNLVESSLDAERQVAFARNQLLPQGDLNFAVTRRTTSNSFANSFALNGFEFATFFTIAMPVDRTPQQVDYQNALLDRDRRKREIETREREIVNDVRQALREHDRLLRAATASETSVDLGRREVEVAQLRYERGLSNNLDVVNAESSLLAAESRKIQALADAVVAKLRLRAILGTLDPRADLETIPSTAAASNP